DRVLAGAVEAEDREQAVEEGHDEGRGPHRVVPHLQKRPGRGYDDAPQQVLPVQSGTDGRRGGLAGTGGLAGVVGVVADGESLGVAGIVGRVRIRPARIAVAVVAEVLRLTLALGRPPQRLPAVGLRAAVLLLRRGGVAVRRALRRLLSVRG